MFGLIARIKQARAERLRREKLLEEQHARIVQGFREVDTAVELVAQTLSGRGPRGNVLRIGDGFYVERNADGSESTVLLEKGQPQERHTAKLDNFKASVGLSISPPEIQAPEIPRVEIPALNLPEIPALHFTAPQPPKP